MGNLNFLHGGNIYEIREKYGKKVIDFSASINPLGLPSNVKGIISESVAEILHYPDPEAERITRKIADYWGIKEENILVGNGSVDLIYLVVSTFRPKSVLIPVPAFSEYERSARNVGARIKFIKLQEKENFRLDPRQLGESDLLFLPNPNNPTGNLLFADYQLMKRLPNELILVDEAFMDFLPDENRYTSIWRAAKSKKIIIFRTFTKFFALPGLRIGYLVSHKDIVQTLKQSRIPWGVNVLAQQSACCILDDRTYINETKRLIEKERNFLFEEISKIKNLKLYPSVANFLLIKIKGKSITSSLLKEKLVRKGILIRDCANFRGLSNKFVRIAVRSRKENLKLIRAMKGLL